MWPPAPPLPLTAAQRRALEALRRHRSTAQKLALRARIILLCSEGRAHHAIARELQVDRKTVILWRQRFTQAGLEGLVDQSRPGRKPTLSARLVPRILHATRHEQPPAGGCWTTRTMAQRFGISKATVQRIWHAHGLQPHRLETFRLSRTKGFLHRLRDVAGLYLDPPEHALALTSVRHATKQGRRRTPAHLRDCGPRLFAALEALEASLLESPARTGQRPNDFLGFLRRLKRGTPRPLDIHLLIDNYSSCREEEVQTWLARHSRFHLHFVPRSAPWLPLVRRWFSEISDHRLRPRVFEGVTRLEDSVYERLGATRAAAGPFVWIAPRKR